MKILNKSFIFTALAAAFVSCGNEAPFDSGKPEEETLCEFPKSALDLNVQSDDNIKVRSRAGETDVILDDFRIVFKKGSQTVKSLKYGEMPDIMMLNEGTYTVTASYGENADAAFDNPVFQGTSGEFDVKPGSIGKIDPIQCRLTNVKVTIIFDATLAGVMSEDSYVEVKLKNAGNGLRFSKGDTNAGYFNIGDERTLAATFYGTINGSEVSESKTLDNVEGGNHYRITFKLHSQDSANNGDHTTSVNLDASVSYENITNNISVKDVPLKDGERPVQGGDIKDDDPGNDTDKKGPSVSAYRPVDEETGEPMAGTLVDLDIENDCEGLVCALRFESEAEDGFTAFDVEIDSDTLTEDELGSVGLQKHLDLVNTGDPDVEDSIAQKLQGLGFPINVGGSKSVDFNITGFMPMLKILGNGHHKFIMTVRDANGTKTVVLKIKS